MTLLDDVLDLLALAEKQPRPRILICLNCLRMMENHPTIPYAVLPHECWPIPSNIIERFLDIAGDEGTVDPGATLATKPRS